MSADSKKWLVKNSNQIIGPFTEAELKAELAKGYMSPFATACLPGQEFWMFIAAYPEFTSYTDVSKLTKHTATLKTIFEQTLQTEIIGQHIPPKKSTGLVDQKATPYQVIEEADSSTDEPKRKTSGFFLTVGLALVLLSIGYVFFYPLRKSSAPPQKDMGRIYFSVGNYAKAFQIWAKEDKAGLLNKDNETLFQILKFQLNDNITGGSWFSKEGGTSSETAQMIKALQQMKADDLPSAGRAFSGLMQTGSSQDIKQSALANRALISARTGECDFFNKHSESAFRNLIYFSFAFCLLQSDSQKNKATALLRQITQKPRDYYQEALLGLAYIYSGQNALSFIERFLDSDPYLTEEYFYNAFIDRKIYSWPQLLPFCESVYSTNKNHKLFIAFYSYCLTRAHRYEKARSFIKKAELIDSDDVLVKTVHAYIADSIKLKNQFVLMLGDAIQLNSDMKYILPYILQARFCSVNKDWKCAVQNWNQVLRNTPDSLSGLGGMAYAKYSQGQYESTRAYIHQGRVAEGGKPRYSLLLFVEKMLKGTAD